MRRNFLLKSAIVLFAGALMAPTCGTTSGLGPRTFTAGALVIPMDNCYQKRDASASNQTRSCNAASDDGIFRAYGIVYMLLKHNITVYWAIDAATPKTSVTGADVVVPAPSSGVVVRKYNWSTGVTDVFSPAFPAATAITYIGGPFIIDPADKAAAINLFNTSPDFAPFKSAALVDVHEVQVGFTAPQVRPLVGPPPKVAILYSYTGNTSAGVMVGYAKAAGFDWTCGAGCSSDATCKAGGKCVGGVCQDCAGGISKADPTCTKSYVQTQFGIAAVNDGPGVVYDILCDKDFLPNYTASPPDFSTASLLRKDTSGAYIYKLLWAPHWESGGLGGVPKSVVPNPTGPVGTAQRSLADWLDCINKFVAAGNNLFAECHAIVTLEGGWGVSGVEYGLPITRFQSTNMMSSNTSSAVSSVATFVPTEPNMQIADFAFASRSGSVASFLADPTCPSGTGCNTGSVSSSYRAGVTHFITQTGGSPNRDLFTSINNAAGGVGGAAVYFGGHDYNGYTAGTRIVLNTLFNLGFGCADPNTACNTGLPGVCSAGRLKCASGGGLECVQDTQPAPADLCLGQDDNCDGVVNGGCVTPVCTSGQTRSCYPNATSCVAGTGNFTCEGTVNGCVDNGNGTFTCAQNANSVCTLGTQTCGTTGVWGACTGTNLPRPEVCNGKDDDCNGTSDGGTLCYPGYTCQTGFCVPSSCSAEMSICPIGYDCTSVSGGTCAPKNCPSVPCPAGQACVAPSTCADPCATKVCGLGASCSAGECQGGACYSYGCPTAGDICTGGRCIADPCASATCPTGTFCRAGDCVRSCAFVHCTGGQVCGYWGFCVDSPCSPACITGQVCDAGLCKPDPACAGVGCGNGQTCTGGTCIDLPCSNMSCPTGVCVEGQCVTGDAPEAITGSSAKKSGCGCGSVDGLDLSALGLAAVALITRRRRTPRAVGPGSPGRGRSLLAGLAAAILVLTVAGCPDKKSTCVDVQTDPANCGSCGNACQSGWTCSGGSCVLPTLNPYLRTITPSAAGLGGTVSMDFAGDTFQTGAVARFKGAGLDTALALDVTSGGSAHLASLDLTRAVPGTAQVWILNPGNLISNPLTFTLESDAVVTEVSPSSVLQDASPTVLTVLGDRFATGVTTTLTLKKQWDGTTPPSATPVSLTTTWVSAQQATASSTPQALAIGLHDLQVRNPGGPISNAVSFAVNPGHPVLTSISHTCATPGAVFTLTATGSWFYPTSSGRVVLKSGGTPVYIPGSCASGIDSLGKCVGGQLTAPIDLAGAAIGTYSVWVVNSGNYESARFDFCVKATCPTQTSCP